jgi:hypothetical protein
MKSIFTPTDLVGNVPVTSGATADVRRHSGRWREAMLRFLKGDVL